MKKTLLLLTLSSALLTTHAQTISTVAGNGVAGYSGDGGQATAAELTRPYGVNFDNSGNFYIANSTGYSIREVNTSGVISTFAGISGTFGFSGDGGQATAAKLSDVATVYFDAAGNAFIADWGNNRVRMVNTSGIISTFAGMGAAGYSGDGGQATAAEMSAPFDIIKDGAGNMYIADANNYAVRMINTNGVISTIAGTGGVSGYSGDGGPATAAKMSYPYGLALDAAGDLILSDWSNYRVRKVNTSGIISTIAGTGVSGFSGDGGPATAAELTGPTKVIIDAAGDIFIADYSNSRIRKINTNGIISTVAGSGSAGFSGDGGPATAADLNSPLGICYDAANNLYIADAANNRIRMVSNIVTATAPELKQADFAVYPNPTNGKITIESSGISGKSLIEVYNMLGEKVYSQQLNIEHLTLNIDLSSQPSGIYMLKLQADGNVLTKKIEITR